ncbi:unnamed protein product [Symbiodinium sp. CCMP2456]|nr:unnamed protein product [Symbiodinium sp. CCMP2456]
MLLGLVFLWSSPHCGSFSAFRTACLLWCKQTAAHIPVSVTSVCCVANSSFGPGAHEDSGRMKVKAVARAVASRIRWILDCIADLGRASSREITAWRAMWPREMAVESQVSPLSRPCDPRLPAVVFSCYAVFKFQREGHSAPSLRRRCEFVVAIALQLLR